MVACSDKKIPEKLLFEGESNNWRVVLEVTHPESSSNSKVYQFSYIGEGTRPSVFKYVIEDANFPPGTTGEGNLEKQEEMWLSEAGDSKPIYKISKVPITINWNGNTEELLLKLKK